MFRVLAVCLVEVSIHHINIMLDYGLRCCISENAFVFYFQIGIMQEVSLIQLISMAIFSSESSSDSLP